MSIDSFVEISNLINKPFLGIKRKADVKQLYE